jgi:hypothetical protein
LTVQVHDYNAGIAPSGLFWTLRVPDTAFMRDEDTATLRLEDLSVVDSFQIFSGVEVPATVSYDITWTATGRLRRLFPGSTDAADPTAFAGRFRLATATGTFSGSSSTMPGGTSFSFSGPASSEALWSEMGMERNGVFLTRRP